jgi:simple sugar transport system ATP-binding protein
MNLGEIQLSSMRPIIKLNNISKAFGPIKANKNISLEVNRGAIHGIVGENGAGKSTLMSILYGFYKADTGDIEVNGEKVMISDSQTAIGLGIGMVFQHFKLVETFSVLENIILGAEDGVLIKNSMDQARNVLKKLAQEYELNVNPDSLIENLGVGMQQRVEILKALYRKAEILILDEPTGVLTPAEAEHLFRILRNLKNEGKTIILITHKLREIMSITDTVSVMRQGEMTTTINTHDTNPQKLAEMMVGRKVLLEVNKKKATPGRTKFKLENLNFVDSKGVHRLKDISFQISAGEILGVAGVAGNGQSELLEVISGISKANGNIIINGISYNLNDKESNAHKRREQGIAHVPEDRQKLGLVMDYSAWENMCLGYQNNKDYRENFFFMKNSFIQNQTSMRMGKFDIRPPNPYLMTKKLFRWKPAETCPLKRN